MKNILIIIGLICFLFGGYSLYKGTVEISKVKITEDTGREYTGNVKRSYEKGREVRSYEYTNTGDRGPNVFSTKDGKIGAFVIFIGILSVLGTTAIREY